MLAVQGVAALIDRTFSYCDAAWGTYTWMDKVDWAAASTRARELYTTESEWTSAVKAGTIKYLVNPPAAQSLLCSRGTRGLQKYFDCKDIVELGLDSVGRSGLRVVQMIYKRRSADRPISDVLCHRATDLRRRCLSAAIHEHYISRYSLDREAPVRDMEDKDDELATPSTTRLSTACSSSACWSADEKEDAACLVTRLCRAAAEIESCLAGEVPMFGSTLETGSRMPLGVCQSFAVEQVALAGAGLVQRSLRELQANGGAKASLPFGLIGPLPSAENNYKVYGIKLGEIYLSQQDGDFQYWFEEGMGQVQTCVNGDIIDNDFLDRVACVVHWGSGGGRRKRPSTGVHEHDDHFLRKALGRRNRACGSMHDVPIPSTPSAAMTP